MADAQAKVGGGGEYQDDIVILNGVELAVESPIRGGMVSEFATGMKVGRATYDEREHAFWISLEDFSGGMGFRYLDVREAGGTHWDNDGGVDLRRPRHITLPGRRNTLDSANDPALVSLFFIQNSIFYSNISGADRLYVGIMEDVYSLDVERNSLTRRYDGSADSNASLRIGRIVEHTTTTGVRFLLASGVSALGGTSIEYLRSTDGDTWTKSSDLPATPSANASLQTSDMIVWRDLVIAHGETDQMIGTADGIAWEVDSASVLNDHWRTGDIAVNFCGTSMSPWGDDAVYFISKGSLWILDWDIHNAVQIRDLGDRNVLRLGTVWNGSVIVTDGWNVWEYNPGNAQTVRRIGLWGKDGPPATSTSQAGHEGLANDYHITQFIPGTSDLFAVCRSLTVPRSWRLVVYNGIGWSWYGAEVANSQPYAASMGAFPTGTSLQAVTRAIDVAALGDQNENPPVFTLHTIHLPPSGDVPQRGPGQRYEDGPLTFETGWFDGGFAELTGAVIRLTIDGFHITDTETVKVEYRLHNNEDATYINLGTYKNNQQEFWFGENHQGTPFTSIQFRVTLDRGIGTEFSYTGVLLDDGTDINDSDTALVVDDTVGFRIGDVIRLDVEQMQITAIASGSETLTVTRGFNSTTAILHLNNVRIYAEIGVSPELKSLILVYDKVPNIRTAWTIHIDVSRMIGRSFNIAEETATVENIWQFLKSVVNTPTLARLVIPSIESGGMNVRITDMPATFEEFRKSVTTRGFIQLQCIETVGP